VLVFFIFLLEEDMDMERMSTRKRRASVQESREPMSNRAATLTEVYSSASKTMRPATILLRESDTKGYMYASITLPSTGKEICVRPIAEVRTVSQCLKDMGPFVVMYKPNPDPKNNPGDLLTVFTTLSTPQHTLDIRNAIVNSLPSCPWKENIQNTDSPLTARHFTVDHLRNFEDNRISFFRSFPEQLVLEKRRDGTLHHDLVEEFDALLPTAFYRYCRTTLYSFPNTTMNVDQFDADCIRTSEFLARFNTFHQHKYILEALSPSHVVLNQDYEIPRQGTLENPMVMAMMTTNKTDSSLLKQEMRAASIAWRAAKNISMDTRTFCALHAYLTVHAPDLLRKILYTDSIPTAEELLHLPQDFFASLLNELVLSIHEKEPDCNVSTLNYPYVQMYRHSFYGKLFFGPPQDQQQQHEDEDD